MGIIHIADGVYWSLDVHMTLVSWLQPQNIRQMLYITGTKTSHLYKNSYSYEHMFNLLSKKNLPTEKQLNALYAILNKRWPFIYV